MDETGEILIREKEEKAKRMLPYKEVLRYLGGRLSTHRLRRLLNTGRIKGEKRYRRGQRGYPWMWQTTVEAVKKYLASLKTPQEYGRMGGRPPKKGGEPGIGKKGVVYKAR
jgi:hypothetical protein